MIRIVDVNEAQLIQLKSYIFETETMGSTTHPFYHEGEKKVFKLFKNKKKFVIINS